MKANSAEKSFSISSNYSIWVIACTLTYFFCSLLFSKGMFSGRADDGFYMQMLFVANNWGELNILSFVHKLRFISIYPFWWLTENEFNLAWQNIILFLYMLPVFIVKAGKTSSYTRFLILALPFILSYRTCLLITSMSLLYLYIYSPNKKNASLFLSALFANLSSGVVLPWLASAILFRKSIAIKKINFMGLIFLLTLSLSTSVTHKISYFNTLTASNNDYLAPTTQGVSVYCDSAICVAMKRSTIFVSYHTEQYRRLAVYCSLLLLFFFTALFCQKYKKSTRSFFLLSLGGFFVEGLWVISYSVPVLLFWSDIIGQKFEQMTHTKSNLT